MNAIKMYFLDVFAKHYVDFAGRATRKQFWMFQLFLFIAGFIVAALTSFLGDLGQILYYVCCLAVFLPSLAIGARRLHDTGRSAWWLLLEIIPFGVIVLIIFWVMPTRD